MLSPFVIVLCHLHLSFLISSAAPNSYIFLSNTKFYLWETFGMSTSHTDYDYAFSLLGQRRFVILSFAKCTMLLFMIYFSYVQSL